MRKVLHTYRSLHLSAPLQGSHCQGEFLSSLAKQIIITKTYLLPWDFTGNGPLISHDNMSKGYFALMVSRRLVPWVEDHCVVGKGNTQQSTSVYLPHTLPNSIVV